MKKLIAFLMAVVMLLVPLTCTAYAGDNDGVNLAGDTSSLIKTLTSPIDALFAPLKQLFELIRTVIREILGKTGLVTQTTGADFIPREWEKENRVSSVSPSVIKEFNDLIAKAKASEKQCVCTTVVTNTYLSKGSSGGSSLIGSIEGALEAVYPAKIEFEKNTRNEGDILSDMIAPYGSELSPITIANVKSAVRTNNNDGTATLTLTMYNEDYTYDSPYLGKVIPYGVFNRSQIGTSLVVTDNFNAHLENVKLSVKYKVATEEIIEECFTLNGFYDIAATCFVSDDIKSYGWAYFNTETKMVKYLYWQ